MTRLVFRDMSDRLMTHIVLNPATGCWHWTGYVRKAGYGIINIRRNGKNYPRHAHRVAYETFRGPVPEGMQVDHLCRRRDCINPSHMEVVTPGENTRRGIVAEVQRQRHAKRTHCKNGHLLSADNVYQGHCKGFPARGCKICRKAADQRFRAKRRGLLP